MYIGSSKDAMPFEKKKFDDNGRRVPYKPGRSLKSSKGIKTALVEFVVNEWSSSLGKRVLIVI